MENSVHHWNNVNGKKISTNSNCAGCNFSIKTGDLFYEALSQTWHIECFSCQVFKIFLSILLYNLY